MTVGWEPLAGLKPTQQEPKRNKDFSLPLHDLWVTPFPPRWLTSSISRRFVENWFWFRFYKHRPFPRTHGHAEECPPKSHGGSESAQCYRLSAMGVFWGSRPGSWPREHLPAIGWETGSLELVCKTVTRGKYMLWWCIENQDMKEQSERASKRKTQMKHHSVNSGCRGNGVFSSSLQWACTSFVIWGWKQL